MLQKSTGIEKARVGDPVYHRVIILFFQGKNARHEDWVPEWLRPRGVKEQWDKGAVVPGEA